MGDALLALVAGLDAVLQGGETLLLGGLLGGEFLELRREGVDLGDFLGEQGLVVCEVGLEEGG